MVLLSLYRIMSYTLSVRLPKSSRLKLEEAARYKGVSVSHVVKLAIERFLQGYEVRKEVRELKELLLKFLSDIDSHRYLTTEVGTETVAGRNDVEGLPSFFHDNPWLNILKSRR